MASVRLRGLFIGDNAVFQRQDVPTPVKKVAAIYLLLAVTSCLYFVFLVSTMPVAWFALVKMPLSIAVAFGLLNLREGWRKSSVFISGYAVLVIPFECLAIHFSSDFHLFMSRVSGIDSSILLSLVLVLSFVMFLWMFITLRRPDIKRAFESGGQGTLAT
jgi:hypothetical protein